MGLVVLGQVALDQVALACLANHVATGTMKNKRTNFFN